MQADVTSSPVACQGGKDSGFGIQDWIPAFAGMTGVEIQAKGREKLVNYRERR